jgi:hypothetical protein
MMDEALPMAGIVASGGAKSLRWLGAALLFGLGLVVIWAPPRPPMVDLPQHAGQIALLRDLALGHSPWAAELRVDLLTPYLIGYGLAFPLALVMPVSAAIKTVLTAAFIGFVAASLAIRRELAASPELDAYFFVPFFGLAYGWGLYTFLVAAPVALAFVWLAIRYARLGGAARAIGLAALGLALVLCHGLACVIACAIGLAVLAVRAPNVGGLLARAWPCLLPLLPCALFVLAHGRFGGAGGFPVISLGAPVTRLLLGLSASFTDSGGRWPLIAAVVLIVLPWVGGLSVDWRERDKVAIAAVVLAMFAFSPLNVGWIGAIYTRFALFLLPAYAWLFRRTEKTPTGLAAVSGPWLQALAAGVCMVLLAWQAIEAERFTQESRAFDTILARAEPGQRALDLILDQGAPGYNPYVFMHFGLWYQADKRGLTDFNFAAFPSQIVRLRQAPSPVNADGAFEWTPSRFRWTPYDGGRYQYFFVRDRQPIPAGLFAGAPCVPRLVASSGPWSLFQRQACAGSASP